MRVKEKFGQRPQVTLDKSETARVYEASYILRLAGKHLENDTLIELAANVKLAMERLSPQWTPNPETGELEATPPAEQPEVKPPTKK